MSRRVFGTGTIGCESFARDDEDCWLQVFASFGHDAYLGIGLWRDSFLRVRWKLSKGSDPQGL